MPLFLSTYLNKLDKKGRVSVPAPFRSTLLDQPFQGIVVYRSFVANCLEACSFEQMEKLSNMIDQLDPYSEERDAFATSILGGSVQLGFDTEGRVLLPEDLIEFAQINEQVCFVGKGSRFEIWAPEIFKTHADKSREIAKNNRHILQTNRA